MRFKLVIGCLAACVVGYGASAHIRIKHPTNGSNLYWGSPSSIGLTTNSTGSDDIDDGSHEIAVSNAVDAWNSIPGSAARIVENTNPASKARTDWAADDIHLVYFDETGSSGYFPGSSGVVAITPLWFLSDGRITDADILFNGKNFQFTTSGESGHFDVQDVVTHEMGHFLGLDHSGHTGAAMYPFVDPTVILHRSLALDDQYGIRAAYPAGSFGRIDGRIERLDSTAVQRAHVVAVDLDGRTAGAALAGGNGSYQLRGLDPGTYRIYADPLDDPVSAANLTGTYAVDVDFESTFYAGTHTVAAGQVLNIGTLEVGDDVTVQLGRNFDRLPRRATRGTTTTHSLRGSGLVAGSTLVASDPDITITPISWLGTVVTFQVTVPDGEPNGHVDLTVVEPGGDVDLLVGGLEVCPPDPVVTSVTPSQGSMGGGNSVTIVGSGFEPGARVVIGDRVYVDGVAGGCTVVDDSTILLTTAATVGGAHDVVVIDSTGVEGRASAAFQATDVPAVASVFPSSGSLGGGTAISLVGEDFVSTAQVTVDGVTAGVTFVNSGLLQVLTPPGTATGPVVVEVLNPGGLTASSIFTYVGKVDPIAVGVAPATGAAAGGEAITISGANFSADSAVLFGTDPSTGVGGSAAASVTLIDVNTLRVVTPGGAGTVSIVVRDSTTGQASVLPAAFTFVPESGGGGGCGMIATPGPGPWREVLAGTAWVAALLAFGALRSIAARRQLAA